MTTNIYVPNDSAAISVGADEVCSAISARAALDDLDIRIVRTSSRGMFWLEPLIEVDSPAGRIGYGPVRPADIAALLSAATAPDGPSTDHPLCVGRVDAIDWLARQQRLIFARAGITEPLSISDYQAHGGFAGLRRALTLPAPQLIEEIVESGLRGRGGAGFPAGIKWRTVARATSDQKFVVANADEGDSGTFADRMLMEGDPFALIEGIIIAAYAVGASEAYVYVRSEYPRAYATMRAAVESAHHHNLLGANILGTDLCLDIQVRLGAGAYICGEETAMLESLESRRGQVRAKPPLPALAGLFGQPTVVNNVLTLASVPWIVAHGAGAYAAHGTGTSRGTQVFQLAGNIARGGIVETAFGATLGDLVNGYGGGTRSGRAVRAIQVGGPLGAYFGTDHVDLPMTYDDVAGAQGMLGHGGIVVFDDTVHMARQARFAMEFCAAESCGTCTPCRVGAVRGVETLDRIIAGDRVGENLALLEDLCEVMTDGSLCAMGSLTPLPVRSAIRHFGEDFDTSMSIRRAEDPA